MPFKTRNFLLFCREPPAGGFLFEPIQGINGAHHIDECCTRIDAYRTK